MDCFMNYKKLIIVFIIAFSMGLTSSYLTSLSLKCSVPFNGNNNHPSFPTRKLFGYKVKLSMKHGALRGTDT